MSKKTFFASQWFQKDVESLTDSARARRNDAQSELLCPKGRFPTFSHQTKPARPPELPTDKFSPLHCFVPGWKGDSLLSKNVIKFERVMTMVQLDVKNELFKTKDFPKTIKLGLYNEFLSYAETLGLHFDGMDDLGKFWGFITPEKLQEEKHLAEFIDIYANRVATIKFLKLRFISSLLDRCGIELTDKALLYPTSFLSQIFKKGSVTELQSRALESNLYSWYRPHEGMKEAMKELLHVSKELAITEITKHISFRTQVAQDQQKVYSHALSHSSMGLFLNSLQINFPLWLETIESRSIPVNLEEERIISCKYFGDYLESLSLSHWLAQENNIDFRWDEILCPDFKGLEFVSGTFAKICNELQFLTFLSHKADYQGEKPIDYICKIMGGHFKNRKNTIGKQALLLEENPFYTSTYDRVVLNLCEFPKNNPQHYLMTQIMDQVKYLKHNGYLFVLSSKKLFVPSLRERLGPVLRELKTEAIFDFENVKGKGELGSYIYIFRKKNKSDSEKQLCSYFRISVELENFQQFSSVTEHLRSFYLSHLQEMPPMAHLDFKDNFRIEFFQEAVVNGMLIHSASEDSTRITHPSYFKSLLANCVTLDTIFEIKSLLANEKNSLSENAMNLGLKRDVAYFLVVDFRGNEVNLELHPMDTFRSIHSDYGETLCSYFQLLPKIPGLNPNILRNYFNTTVGRQVSNLTFTGGPNLVKGSLSKFLVPKFLTETETLPEHMKSGFKILDMTEDQLLDSNPKEIQKVYSHIDQLTKDVFPRFACEILSRFSNFERTLEALVWKLDDVRMGQTVSFNNPLIHAQLVARPTKPMYSDNEDIYLEFVEGTNPSDIHLPLTELQVKVSHEGELKLYFLELISHKKVIVRMHAEEAMVLFVQFICSHALNAPISKIMKAVHVPSIKDLKDIIVTTKDFKVTYEALLKEVQNSIMNAMRLQVLPGRKS